MTRVRILVAEDHEPFRRFICSILGQQPGLQVVGEVSDGLEAVAQAAALHPDLIVLDIGLPTLNGIAAARQIRTLSPESKLLFLSIESDPALVRETLNLGALGYVHKSRAHRELLRAIKAVLRGQHFVSANLDDGTLRAATRRGSFPRHEVQFYSADAILEQSFTRFITPALKAGHAAIVVATGSHRDGILRGLKADGVDVEAAIQQGVYVSLDAAETLSAFMVDDWPDPVRFFSAFGTVIERVSRAAASERSRVAVCGEGVTLLWAAGKTGAAIRAEQLCNDLARKYDVDILCAYPHRFHIHEDEDAFGSVCREHSAAYSDEDELFVLR
jgi:DNA-binding NarL/FixJ family response regulator